MSVLYYLVNKETKTFYKLGKGGWYFLKNNEDLCYFTDIELLEEVIYGDVFDGYENKNGDFREYCKEITKEIFEAAKCNNLNNLFVISDAGEQDDLIVIKALKYKCIGCRYRDWDVNSLNKHLESYHTSIEELQKYKTQDVYIEGRGWVPIGEFHNPYKELLEKYQ